MYCQNCGKEVNDNAAICLGCGMYVNKKRSASSENSSNILNWIFALISIVASVNAVLWVIPNLYSVIDLYSSMLQLDTAGIVLLWVFTGIALASGFFAVVFCFIKKIDNKLPHFIALLLSISVLVFAIICSATL